MKKRLLSLLMAVLMLVSLVPAVYADGAAVKDVNTCTHEKTSVVTLQKADSDKKIPGVKAEVCDACGDITDVDEIIPFVKHYIFKCDHEKTATMVVKEPGCLTHGLTINYCTECGEAIGASGFTSGYRFDAYTGHVCVDFYVYQKPTCNTEGWGYAVCKNCGDAIYVAGATEAAERADYTGLTGAQAGERAQKIYDMFAALNPGHKDASKLVAVTKETTVLDENDEEVTLKPAAKATHVAQVTTDKGVVYLNNETGAGYKGDLVCPYCDYFVQQDNPADAVESLNTAHKIKVTEKGSLPYYDAETGKQMNGKTDAYTCEDCGRVVRSTTIKFSDVYPNTNKAVGERVVEDKVEACCCHPGYTGDTYVYEAVKNADGSNKLDEYGYVVTARSQEPVKKGTGVPQLSCKWTLVEPTATCEADGDAYLDYYVCACDCEDCTCGTKGDQSKTIPLEALGHKDVTTVVVEASCTSDGLSYTQCSVCEKYKDTSDPENPTYSKAFVINTTKGGNHVAADTLKDAKDATCKEVGYTGDKVCKFCGEVLEKGEEIKVLEHKTELKNAKDATCAAAGYTGDEVCTVCGEVVKKGTEIAKGQHKTELKNVKDATCTAAGYSGDEVCTVCGETVKKGEETALAAHKFANGVCTVCGAKDTTVNPFKDVNKTTHADYYDAILWGYYNGVVKGTNNAQTLFSPEATCTRAQIVTFLYRAEKASPVTGVTNPFTDVSATADKDYYDAIMWAVKNGIVEGTSATTFDPYATCTRAQIVTMLYRLEGEPAVTNKTVFTDLTADWYISAVNWAFNLGIAQGTGNGAFSPDAPCTRAQTITFIYRYYNT